MITVLLLILSNILLNTAWYWHLLYPNVPLWQAIVFSWFIALFDYGVAVPVNRIGYFQYQFTPAQLKIMQEAITLAVLSSSRWWCCNNQSAGITSCQWVCSL